jgi:hypothetical protein
MMKTFNPASILDLGAKTQLLCISMM